MSDLRVIKSDKEAIQYVMDEEQISHAELSKKMNCHRQYIGQILNRNSSGVRFDSFMKIMNTLGYEVCIRKVEQ